MRACLLTTALLVITPFTRAEPWPEFRGPTGQGVVRVGGLPLEWGPDKNVAWKTAVPGGGWSSPIVFGGRVYLTTSVPDADDPKGDQSLRTLCLDAVTGKVLWNQEIFPQAAGKAPRIHTKNTHASPTPVTDGRHLYVHFGHQGTACLDLDGKVLWRNTSLTYAPVHGNGGSPILVDGLLVFSCDGGDQRFVVALDRKTGEVVWKTDRPGSPPKKFSFSTPLLIEVDGRKQIVSTGSDMVGAYDPQTGREIWRVHTAGGYSVVPRPVFGHGLVFVCTGFNTPSLLAIRPDGQGDVTATHVAWSVKKSVSHTPSPLLDGDELYLVSDKGVASCLDAKTGAVHWQERVGGDYSASPVLAAGRVYFQSEQGTGVVVQAGKQFKELARNVLDERTLASYAAADGALFLRTEKHLYRFEEK